MRKKLRMLISAFVITTIFVSAAGITFSSLDVQWLSGSNAQEIQIMLQEDTETFYPGNRTLKPGEPVTAKPYLVNTGTSECYVRVKVNVPQYKSIALFRLGYLRGEVFYTLEFTASEAQGMAYWEQNGEYLYYRNKATDDKLHPGELTPVLYSAVMLSGEISAHEIESLQGSREIVICAEAANTGAKNVLEAFSAKAA